MAGGVLRAGLFGVERHGEAPSRGFPMLLHEKK
jgi:hypothetical protein